MIFDKGKRAYFRVAILENRKYRVSYKKHIFRKGKAPKQKGKSIIAVL